MTARIVGWKYFDRLFQLGQAGPSAPAANMVMLIGSLLGACGRIYR
jgi:hypothetical protein